MSLYSGAHSRGQIRPCPFCGTEMTSHAHVFSHPAPKLGRCFLKGYSFGNEHVRQWNNRQNAEKISIYADPF